MVCVTACQRLDKFESQRELADLIKQSGDGMDTVRKEVDAVALASPTARQEIARLLSIAAPFIYAFKKHTKTATSLLLRCSKWAVCTFKACVAS